MSKVMLCTGFIYESSRFTVEIFDTANMRHAFNSGPNCRLYKITRVQNNGSLK